MKERKKNSRKTNRLKRRAEMKSQRIGTRGQEVKRGDLDRVQGQGLGLDLIVEEDGVIVGVGIDATKEVEVAEGITAIDDIIVGKEVTREEEIASQEVQLLIP